MMCFFFPGCHVSISQKVSICFEAVRLEKEAPQATPSVQCIIGAIPHSTTLQESNELYSYAAHYQTNSQQIAI